MANPEDDVVKPSADTESVYSYKSTTTVQSVVTVATEQLGITVIFSKIIERN